MNRATRTVGAGLVLTAVIAAVTTLVPGAAYADSMSQTPGTSTTGQNWTQATGSVNVWVDQGAAEAAANVCTESIFDWKFNPRHHYDVRLVRRCETSAGSLSTSIWTNNFSGGFPSGVQKYGGCLVGFTNSDGTGGSRSNCEGSFTGGVENVAFCGSGAASCYVKKGGVIRRFCDGNPTSTSC